MHKMNYTPGTIATFAQNIFHKTLYPYQIEIAEAILASVFGDQGRIFTVMLARQSGKNELSAILEAFLLSIMNEGTIVKAAPTFSPQIANSRLRLLSMLSVDELRERMWQSGNMIGLAPAKSSALVRAHAGPRVMFFSAAPTSNVVGATANLLLEIDEAQDVSCEKFDRDFRPMAATQNATTILYGTAWSDHTLLAYQRVRNLEMEQRTGERQHFEYDWRALAAINEHYKTYVEQEIARLGEDHLAIQTQYFLHPISDAGYFLNRLHRELLRGTHMWEDERSSEDQYIASMDIAGEERPTPTGHSPQRDSTVMTIGRVHFNDVGTAEIAVVHHQWWTGKPYGEQLVATIALAEQWSIRSLVVDATGLGASLASLLRDRLGEERVRPFIFTRPSKSRLAYQLIALINNKRLQLYTSAQAPSRIYQECWHQLCHARYRLPAPDTMDFYVDPTDGHDDFVISLALLGEALKDFTHPSVSTIIRPQQLYSDESSF